jgi:hypothetical protein
MGDPTESVIARQAGDRVVRAARETVGDGLRTVVEYDEQSY